MRRSEYFSNRWTSDCRVPDCSLGLGGGFWKACGTRLKLLLLYAGFVALAPLWTCPCFSEMPLIAPATS